MLEDAGLRVRCAAPGVDERAFVDDDPTSLATTLAVAKARAVASRESTAFVLGADQVVTDGNQIWGKPASVDDHVARLLAMRGQRHTLITGFCLVTPSGREVVGTERTHLTMRADLEEAEIRAYVASGEGSGCAGGYAIEGRGIWLFSSIEGDWFNIIGLPLLAVLDVLRAEGWRFGQGGVS